MNPIVKSIVSLSSFFVAALVYSTGANAKFDRQGLLLEDQLYFTSASDYALEGNQQIKKFYLLGNKPGYHLQLNLDVSALLKSDVKTIDAHIQCDSDVLLDKSTLFLGKIKAKDISFRLFHNVIPGHEKSTVSHRSPKLYFDESVKKCDLKLLVIKNNGEAVPGGLRLLSENIKFPFLKNLTEHVEDCNYAETGLLAQSNIFLSNKYRNMTCAHNVEKIQMLETAVSGFKAKVKALLGYDVPDSFIAQADPLAPLDFSKAPKLKAIYVASLVYRSDFYGTVISRLLKFHAERGTLIYIITTGYMQSDEDHKRLRQLARENGNIRLQEYQYNAVEKGLHYLAGKIDEMHRDMHIKMFVTLSEKPEENIIITGGRNIHDGFLFEKKPAYEKYPIISQYAQENHVYWSDFEMQVTSASFAKSMFAHLLTFWNRETQTQKVNFIDQKISGQTVEKLSLLNVDQPLLRHVISLPFNDDQALEKIYVDMIDQAQKTIKFSSPYLRPTKKISAALDRAVARGVDITIQTRINLEGDTAAWLYMEMNKASINHFKDSVKVYEWMQPSILHSKFILVDNKVAFVGSVNVSRRSFVHDIESGFLIYSENLVNQLDAIFQGYNAKSRIVTDYQKPKLLPATIIKIVPNLF